MRWGLLSLLPHCCCPREISCSRAQTLLGAQSRRFGSTPLHSDKQASQALFRPCFLLVWDWGWRSEAIRDFLKYNGFVFPNTAWPLPRASCHFAFGKVHWVLSSGSIFPYSVGNALLWVKLSLSFELSFCNIVVFIAIFQKIVIPIYNLS